MVIWPSLYSAPTNEGERVDFIKKIFKITMEAGFFGKKKALVALVLLLACLIPVAIRNFGHSFDDAYITYRYALNLARGQGFVYNPGERHLGTTSPLFTLFLALGGLFYKDIPFWGSLFSILSLGTCAWFVFMILARATSFWTGFLAIPLVIFNPVLVASLGNETNLLLTFLLGQYYCFQRGNLGAFAVLGAMGTLTRGEGILLTTLLFWFELQRQVRVRRYNLRPLFMFIAIVLPWLIFSYAYFGSLLPSTLRVKMTMTRIQGSIWKPFFQYVIANLPSQLFPALSTRLFLFALSLIGMIGALIRRKFVALLFFFLAFFLSYSFLRVAGFPWYQAPLALAFSFFSIYGVYLCSLFRWHRLRGIKIRSAWELLGKWFLRLEPDFSPTSSPPATKSLLLFSILSLLLIYSFTQRGIQFHDDRLAPYREAGLWLKENASLSSSVGIPEVGIIGYFAELRMLDIDGLVFPAMSLPGRMHNYQYLIRTYHPDYIISQERVPYPELRPGDVHPGVRGLPYCYLLAKQIKYPHLHVAIWKRNP